MFAPRQWESPWPRRSRQRCSTQGQSAAAFTNGTSRSDARSTSLGSTAKPVPIGSPLGISDRGTLVLKPLLTQLGLTRVKVALSGGSTMAPDVFRLFHAIGVPLRNIYGSTEIGIMTIPQGRTHPAIETVGHWLEAPPRNSGAGMEGFTGRRTARTRWIFLSGLFRQV